MSWSSGWPLLIGSAMQDRLLTERWSNPSA